jgi:hypothetical protein
MSKYIKEINGVSFEDLNDSYLLIEEALGVKENPLMKIELTTCFMKLLGSVGWKLEDWNSAAIVAKEIGYIK